MKRELLEIIRVGCAFFTGLGMAWGEVPEDGADEAIGPPLAAKPYQIGIAPSHITTPTAPLFTERVDDWAEVRRSIDFYKVYSLQAVPPDWASPLPLDSFAAFVKKHKIAVDAEFGAFRADGGAEEGKAAAKRAMAMHAWLEHRGLQLRALHLDGPIRRLMGSDPGNNGGLSLEQAAEAVAVFLSECREAFPGTRIGLITNFPNWHYSPDQPGMLGTWTEHNGVHYRDALNAVHRAALRKGTRFDFVEVDCPLNYYRATRNRSDPSRRVNNAAKFKALQRWCQERDLEFWLVVNYDTNPQRVAGKAALGNRLFHDETLAYIRRLRKDGVFPDSFTIQSWYKLPAEHLPEEGGHSFMHTARDSVRLIRELFPHSDPVKGEEENARSVKVILDTDMSGDCDDAGALGLLHALADLGECELLAVVTNRKDLANASAAAVDVINTYYGRPDIPVGTCKEKPTALRRTSAFTAALRDGFPGNIGSDDSAPDALDIYRRVLKAEPDNSVTICSVGAFSNLATLCRREPELVRAKVRRLVAMGGEYPVSKRARTNIATHPEAARVVATEWPGEIVWHGFEVGQVLITGEKLKHTPAGNPVRRAYELRRHSGRPSIQGGQPSYDQAAAFFAVRGASPRSWQVISGGRVSIDAAGLTTWQPVPSGEHAYVRIVGHPKRLAAEIEALMVAPPKKPATGKTR